MKFLIGYKKEMTQHFREDGSIVPVTIVEVNPLVVTQVKSQEKEGYHAVQLGIGTRSRATKSQAGHLSKVLATGQKPFHRLKEIRFTEPTSFQHGDTFGVTSFAIGDKVSVTGVSKGKGFQGVVKRHGFHGTDESHGNKDQSRMPGSIGAGEPQRVFKGTRMAGRMGGDQVTVRNLEIVAINPEQNKLFVKGALPGARNGMILIFSEGENTVFGNIFEVNKVKSAPQEMKEEVTIDTNEVSPSTEEVPAKQAVKEEKQEEPSTSEQA